MNFYFLSNIEWKKTTDKSLNYQLTAFSYYLVLRRFDVNLIIFDLIAKLFKYVRDLFIHCWIKFYQLSINQEEVYWM